jgi:hypothetical protein
MRPKAKALGYLEAKAMTYEISVEAEVRLEAI